MDVTPYAIDHIHGLYCNYDLLCTKNQYRYRRCAEAYMKELKVVLTEDGHEFHMTKIKSKNFYILSKMLVDKTFTISELAVAQKSNSYKDMINDLSHFVLPNYITFMNCKRINPNMFQAATDEEQQQPQQQSSPTVMIRPHCVSHGEPKENKKTMKTYLPLNVEDRDEVPVTFYEYLNVHETGKISRIPVFDPSNLIT